MDSSYISHFRDSTPSFFLHSYLNYIELLSILRQKYNPVTTKTDIGRRKDEIEDEIQYAYCPERLPLHSKPPFPKQRFRKITSKRNYKIIEI